MTMRTNCILLLVILLGAFPLNRVHADESGSKGGKTKRVNMWSA